jgi:hypothetical protein
MQPFRGLARFNRTHHIRVLDAGAKSGFPNKTGYGSLILAQFLAQYFDSHPAMLRMFCFINSSRSPLTHTVEEGKAGKGCPYKEIARHAANLTVEERTSKRNGLGAVGVCIYEKAEVGSHTGLE